MNAGRSNLSNEKFIAIFSFHLLLFCLPLLSFFWHRNYPIFTSETGVLFLGALTLSFSIAVVLCRARPVISILLSVMLVNVVFIANFDLLLKGIIACLVTSLILAWVLRPKFYTGAMIIMFAMIIGAYFDGIENDGRIRSQQQAAQLASDLPPVLHIILDGFIGADGLHDYPATPIIRQEIYKFFSDYGFLIFPRAYSRYSMTGDSLYSAFNFKNDGDSPYALEYLSKVNHVMRRNAEFQSFENLGYRFNIYQTQHIDFCQSNPKRLDRCWEYDHPNVASIRHAKDLDVRLKMLITVILSRSSLIRNAVKGRLYDQGIAYHDPRVLSNLQDDWKHNPHGRVFLAHVLIPHGPYAFMHDCSINYESNPIVRYEDSGLELEDPAIYEYRTMKYFEQMECALLSLRGLFNEIRNSGTFENAIIVVHGDHGSRIGSRSRLPSAITKERYRADHSTLFAVKFPNGEFSVDRRVLPLSVLLENFTTSIASNGAGGKLGEDFLKDLSEDSEILVPYIFRSGSVPMQRLDINIFEND